MNISTGNAQNKVLPPETVSQSGIIPIINTLTVHDMLWTINFLQQKINESAAAAKPYRHQALRGLAKGTGKAWEQLRDDYINEKYGV